MYLRLSITVVVAVFALQLSAQPAQRQGTLAQFVVPNERNPGNAKRLVTRAPFGVYVAVGSERALFNYLLADDARVQFVLATDRDAGIVRFHQINAVLVRLVARGDVDAYVHLRFDASEDEWRAAADVARQKEDITDSEHAFLSDSGTWHWWRSIVSRATWSEMLEAPARNGFRSVNYLVDPELLTRIQDLASSGRYRSYQIDFKVKQEVQDLADYLRKEQAALAFFDLSNAWEDRYIGTPALGHALEVLNEAASAEALVMFTVGGGRDFMTRYRAFSFRILEDVARKHAGDKAWCEAALAIGVEGSLVQQDLFWRSRSPTSKLMKTLY